MIQGIEFEGVGFVDSRGKYRVIYGCSLKARRELAHALTKLGDRLEKSTFKTVAEAYDYDVEFAAIANFALEASGIDPDWLTLDMMVEFLFPHRDSEGNPQRPILEQLNFPPTPMEGGKGATHAEAIAAIWTHTKNLRAALDAAGYQGEFPGWEEMSGILEAHAVMTDPKAQEKKAQEEIEKKMREDMASGQWGAFVSAPAKIANPQQTDHLLEQILGGGGAL